jgi:hypothetical protein
LIKKLSRHLAIGLILLAGSGSARADCSCQCVNGFMRLRCEAEEDARFGCLPTPCRVLPGGGQAGSPIRPVVSQSCAHDAGLNRAGAHRRVGAALRTAGCREQALNSIKVDRINRAPVLQAR